jgi:inorganic pyrophosphatase
MNLAALPAFGEDDVFHVVVETPRGSGLKLKYEARWEAMSVSRPLPLGVSYPFDWGFIPSTRAADGDPLDAMILWDVASSPGVVVPCRALGVLQVDQRRAKNVHERIRNDRVLCIPVEARREHDVASVTSLPLRIRQELEQFTISATALEGKDVRIVGWADERVALALIRDASHTA